MSMWSTASGDYGMTSMEADPEEVDEREDCPRCRQINWGITPDDRLECVSCGFVEPAPQ